MGGLLPEGSVGFGGGGAVVGFWVVLDVVAAWYNASFLKHKKDEILQEGGNVA